MSLTDIDSPELGSITILLPGSNTEFGRFLSYEMHESLLVPTAGWSFEIDEEELTDSDKTVLVPGTGVEVRINDHRQMTGFIDAIHVRSGRSGTIWHIEGRDFLSPAVDGHIDPLQAFPSTLSLGDFLAAVFGPFGIQVFVDDNFENRNIVTGSVRGNASSKKGKLLAVPLAHQTKPYPNEGAHSFASRVANRCGCYLWPTQDARTLFAGVPDFGQEPRYELRHRRGGADAAQNNILEGSVTQSRLDQPSCIVGHAVGGGGVFPNTSLRAFVKNPVINADTSDIVAAYPSAMIVEVPKIAAASPKLSGNFVDPNVRALFLDDSESHNLNELSHFLLRELSSKMRASLTAEYVIEGHQLNGQPVAVDSIVRVNDDRSNLTDTSLYVVARRFSKRAGDGGTRTTLSCIRPGTLLL